LAAVIATYRRLRPMLHTGTVVHADHPDPAATVSGIVAADRGAALFSYVQEATSATDHPGVIRLCGLDPERRYRVSVLEPAGPAGRIERVPPQWIADGGVTLSGRTLELVGVAAPVLQPEQALLIELTAV